MTDIYGQITDKIIKQLEAGTPPWLKPWKNERNSVGLHHFSDNNIMPVNVEYGPTYHGINVLLLWIAAEEHGFTSNQWLTIKQIKKFKGWVPYDVFTEKFTEVFFMKNYNKVVENEDGESEEQKRLVAKTYRVYNVEQVEGLQLPPKLVKAPVVKENAKNAKKRREDVQAWIDGTGADIRYGGNKACYCTEGDFIKMPHLRQFESVSHFDATEFHEIGHWTGNIKRLGRQFGKRKGDALYAFEELVAEITAAFLCADLGVKGHIRHAEYVASWIKVLQSDKRMIVNAAAQANKAAVYLHDLVKKKNSKTQLEVAA